MRRFPTIQSASVFAAALAAAACVQGPGPEEVSGRDALLDQAFAVVETEPRRAIELFADAGPGPVLETARMSSWARCLDRLAAPSPDWRQFLDEGPPPELAVRARLGLIAALVREADFASAAAERQILSGSSGAEADELLLETTDPAIRRAAAGRLAVSAPQRLLAHDATLARDAAAGLTPEQRLERSRALRRTGLSSRAAAELRRLSYSGEIERERRRELARAELDAGSPRRALRALPSGRNAEASDHALRAQAHRNRGWNFFPDRRAAAAFRECRAEADLALGATVDPATRRAALALKLECATEAGQLDAAFAAWRAIEAESPRWSKRSWLSRRLALALIEDGSRLNDALAIARAVTSQNRCIRYWVALATGEDGVLAELATAPTPDLYARWSSARLGLPSPRFTPAPRLDPAPPPESVRRLVDAGAHREAALEWRRVRLARRPFPEEALAGSIFASSVGRQHDAVTWLLAGFPELGTVHMMEAPENAIQAYLPLRWRTALEDAAREFGIDAWLVAGVARQESTFSAHAVSPRNAVGVLQLLTSTATPHARALGLPTPPDLHDPELNIRLGARELAWLMRRFGAVEPALAAYNGGETRVRRWWRRQPDHQLFTEEIAIPETYNYVRRVLYLSEAYRLLYDSGRR